MAYKYNDLLELKNNIKKQGFKKEFTLKTLDRAIAEKFGFFPVIMNRVKKSLKEFEIIEEIGSGIFRFKTTEDYEKEADNLIKEVVKDGENNKNDNN